MLASMREAPEGALDPREWYAAVVESADLAILTKRLDGEILTWNDAAEALYGYSATEAVGRSVSMLLPDDRPDEVDRILERLAAG